MSTEGFFAQALVYLGAAVVAVPVAKKLGLGSVLGYLLAGVLIGPFGLGLVGEEGQDVMHFAEFGVVMMLFVVGLELAPALLWRLRRPILGLGGLQVAATTALLSGGGLALGLPWQEAVAVGMTLALSSTAIVLQTLAEKGLLETSGGQSSFSVLLFQDMAVIPMLAVMPLLATHEAHSAAEHAASPTWLEGLAPWTATLLVLAVVAGIVAGGRWLLRPAFRILGRVRMREIFTAAALLLVIGIALLMGRVGLSPALGTFLAGVVLANSEYRHELESDIEPFKGLLLGLFFIAVGASIDFALIADQPGTVAGITVAVVAVKFGVLVALARLFGLGLDQAFLVAFALPQMGEFAFVLFSFAGQEGVLTEAVTSPLVAAVALSMALTPLLLLFNERVLQPRFGTRQKEERDPDHIREENPVIVAGFGSFGSTVGRLLRAKGVGTTFLDHDSERVELLRRLGLEVYYGDATRYDLLEAAGAGRARILVVALDTPERTLALVGTARKHFPQLTILARAFDWSDALALLDAGVDHVQREALESSLRLGARALTLLGFRAFRAEQAVLTFLRHDEETLQHLKGWDDQESRFVSEARRRIEELERLLRSDLDEPSLERDAGWDPESLREEYGSSA